MAPLLAEVGSACNCKVCCNVALGKNRMCYERSISRKLPGRIGSEVVLFVTPGLLRLQSPTAFELPDDEAKDNSAKQCRCETLCVLLNVGRLQ